MEGTSTVKCINTWSILTPVTCAGNPFGFGELSYVPPSRLRQPSGSHDTWALDAKCLYLLTWFVSSCVLTLFLSVFISSVFSVVSVLNLREQSEISHHLLFLWRLAPPLTCTQRHLRMYTQRHLIMHTQRHMIMYTRAFSTFHKINYYQSLLTRSHQYVFQFVPPAHGSYYIQWIS